jgi:uncharacterized DUF497 family protein
MFTFIWDDTKACANFKKHGVSFEEARSVFHDDHARLIADPDHSEEEERFIILGISLKPRLIIVCHCYRENDTVIRIISARTATRREANLYRRFKP